MAFVIPERLASRSAVTAGERKVFVALRDHLPEDYLVYFDVRVKDRHPDFIVVGPDLGVVVLEVKDWRLTTIAGTTPDGVVINTSDGERLVRHPLHQARDYIHRTVDLLKQRPALRTGDHLSCGWGYGVVLPSLKTPDVQTPSLFGPTLEDALGPGLVLTADDLTADRLLPRLRALLPRWAERLPPLTPEQIDEIRAVLYPEIRVGWGPGVDVIEVMDREQERLARSLGDGHRLLRGVAGSGKTVTLMCRARHLRERQPTWRILVLCYNRVLAESLRQAIGVDDRVDVRTFHSWCLSELHRAGVAVPPVPEGTPAWQEHWDRLARLLLDAYAEGRAATGTYQAILVDEGQDFADDWYRVILKALAPDTNSLFVALDASQNIYRRKVSWREIGIQASGRTRVLRVNYRNTRAILAAAYSMIKELDAKTASVRQPEDEYVVPDRAVRNGPPPQVQRHPSRQASEQYAVEWIRTRLARGVAPEHVLLLRLGRLDVEGLAALLNRSGVPASVIAAGAAAGHIRLSTIHSAKGLDASHVILIGGQDLDRRENEEARRLLYIAMTRAREELCVCYDRESPLMAELDAAVGAIPGP